MADKSGMDFVPDLRFVIQWLTLRGREGGKGVVSSAPLSKFTNLKEKGVFV
jgi:hypothetical protein